MSYNCLYDAIKYIEKNCFVHIRLVPTIDLFEQKYEFRGKSNIRYQFHVNMGMFFFQLIFVESNIYKRQINNPYLFNDY